MSIEGFGASSSAGRPALEHAADAMRIKRLRVRPVVDDGGQILGALTARRITTLTMTPAPLTR